ncbi:tRNA-splicing endonuclease subunit Sen15-like [Physella acuta]|uniref:tRNA-splicing endonuclease subunit Sen15-like n=1 Tax=Physella acuta TaxID=109671 RepID=UPI0027DD1138|nr:tRNA-splicing endonuclease subunit Sen15-like [Physella acuta]XP_059148822.1 tRNA-splicing endonuclease subunit Sen15-like [Physella acuta]XP_059148832.1 tRNA-splicing endonuclease subunit Sen15-like [Physella acuta]
MATAIEEDVSALRRHRHPLLEDFLLQYPGCDEDVAQRAFLIYQDLTEVKNWWFTELAYSELFERPYVVGQQSRSEARQAVLPLGVEEKVSLSEIQQYFSNIYVDEEAITNITVAVNELDSTVVYYKLTSGLSPPDSPETVSQHKKEKDQRMSRKRKYLASCVRQFQQSTSKPT